jgi:hypothetical protein
MGFVDPLALVFSALYGVLVVFYLRERRRRREVVPSLLLWNALQEDTLRGRRFAPDLLFYLRLLLLTVLIAALARPFVSSDAETTTSAQRQILVLDVSASMQAREALGTRFSRALERAREVVAEARPEAEIMVIHGGRTPEVAVDFTRDRARVLRALRDTVPTDTGGDIALAVHLARNARARSDVPTAIHVLTDVPRAELPAAAAHDVNLFQVGENDDNAGIETLQVSQGRFQGPLSAHAYVVVENFAHRERHGVLTVDLDESVVHRKGFTLPPRASQGFLLRDFPRAGRVTARLDGRDALPADDVASAWIRPVRPVDLVLVSPPSPLVAELREVADGSPALRLKVVEPDAPLPPADIVVYHGFVPPAWGASNALFLYPPAENALLPVAGDAEAVEVLDWNERHPALRTLQPLNALPLRRARIVNPPPWTETLLSSRSPEREFPLAFAGERHGRRFACLTFDVAAEKLLAPDNIDLLLLFMSLLSWLAPEGHPTLVVNTGDVTRVDTLVPQASVFRVEDPKGNRLDLSADAPFLEPLFVGEYRVTSNGDSASVFANFFDPRESDIGRATTDTVPVVAQDTDVVPPQARRGLREFAVWLYAMAVFLLLAEWMVSER